MDLPIRNLIALRPKDFFPPNATWRNAVKGLHCEGWDDCRTDIVRYFTSEIRDEFFPAPNAYLNLRIGFTGGAAFCKLGNHRAAAAKAWLAANYGEDAILKKVRCFYRPISPPLKPLLKKCITGSSTLKFAHVDDKQVYLRDIGIHKLILVTHKRSPQELYSLDTTEDRLDKIHPSKCFIKRKLKFDLRSKCLRLDFTEVPANLIEIMLNSGSILSQIEENAKDE